MPSLSPQDDPLIELLVHTAAPTAGHAHDDKYRAQAAGVLSSLEPTDCTRIHIATISWPLQDRLLALIHTERTSSAEDTGEHNVEAVVGDSANRRRVRRTSHAWGDQGNMSSAKPLRQAITYCPIPKRNGKLGSRISTASVAQADKKNPRRQRNQKTWRTSSTFRDGPRIAPIENSHASPPRLLELERLCTLGRSISAGHANDADKQQWQQAVQGSCKACVQT